MFRNQLKIALRHLWRNRLFTTLNVLGLSIGLSVTWLIFRLVSYEFAYDQLHPDKERIYRVVSWFRFDGKPSGNPGTPVPLAQTARTAVPGVERVVPVFQEWTSVRVPGPTKKPTVFKEPKDLVATNGNYFALFPHTRLAGGSLTRLLSQPNEVVLTQSRAALYFPGLTPEQVVGRTITYFDSVAVKVTAVVSDLPYLSSFDNKEFLSVSTLRLSDNDNDWGNVNSNRQILLKLASTANAEQVQRQLTRISSGKAAKSLASFNMSPNDRWHVLQPLADVHFGTEFGDSFRKASRTTLYGLMGMALFILLLAVINYINLASAQVPQRAREISIRKTLGGRARGLIGQFVGETLFVTLLALGLAFLLSQAFLTQYGDLLPEGSLIYINWPQVVVFLVGLVACVALLSSWYPGWLITRFQPVAVLRGQTNLSLAPRLTLRKSLIVFQFVIAQAFIVGAMLVGQQLQYALQHDMGFDREAIVTASLPFRGWNNPKDNPDKMAFLTQVRQLPGVAGASLGNLPANMSYSSNVWEYTNKKGKVSFNVFRKYVDTAFVGLYRMPLVAGRNLQPSDTVREFVINETAVKAMGLSRPQDAIGQIIRENGGRATPIVGVVRDFHTMSFHRKVEPVALMSSKESWGAISIRLASKNPADWQATIQQIEQRWKGIYAGEGMDFAPTFYDETIQMFYLEEQKMTRIINLATMIAILLSCLGLFGLATLTAFQRTKEIGVRKVLGASVAGIVVLLSKDFLKLVLIALLLASPLAWWAASEWLNGYVYKVQISPLLFVGAGLLAVAIALFTVSYQSIRAALANPVEALKTE
ncbi:MAG: FtsX-like permease family protein [Cytophagales bacterium]|nr:MAG: FtsX-like permease family protein [Cytophagales bacterium]